VAVAVVAAGVVAECLLLVTLGRVFLLRQTKLGRERGWGFLGGQ